MSRKNRSDIIQIEMMLDEPISLDQDEFGCSLFEPFPQVNQFEESPSVVFAPIIINQPTELSKSPINMFVHKSRWTAAEDDKLTDAVRRFGAKNWGKIAEYVGTRTGKQCRERWIIHHDPSYSHDVWTPEEDQILLEIRSKIGNKWSSIAKHLKGRSTTSIKNRFKFLCNHNMVEPILIEASKFENQAPKCYPQREEFQVPTCVKEPKESVFDEFLPLIY